MTYNATLYSCGNKFHILIIYCTWYGTYDALNKHITRTLVYCVLNCMLRNRTWHSWHQHMHVKLVMCVQIYWRLEYVLY